MKILQKIKKWFAEFNKPIPQTGYNPPPDYPRPKPIVSPPPIPPVIHRVDVYYK